MSKYNKPLFLILIIVIFISFFQLYSFAGNNDSLPPYGYSGKGDDMEQFNCLMKILHSLV
jgi:hypothetical protein